jgi:hypothetical protein
MCMVYPGDKNDINIFKYYCNLYIVYLVLLAVVDTIETAVVVSNRTILFKCIVDMLCIYVF